VAAVVFASESPMTLRVSAAPQAEAMKLNLSFAFLRFLNTAPYFLPYSLAKPPRPTSSLFLGAFLPMAWPFASYWCCPGSGYFLPAWFLWFIFSRRFSCSIFFQKNIHFAVGANLRPRVLVFALPSCGLRPKEPPMRPTWMPAFFALIKPRPPLAFPWPLYAVTVFLPL